MATPSIATSLASDLAALAATGALRGVSEVHLFGSALVRASPRDVDLLVIWDPVVLSSQEAAQLRRVIRAGVEAELPLDITLLTDSERRSVGFPQHSRVMLLYPQPD